MADTSSYVIPLDKTNYTAWLDSIEYVARSKNCWEIMNGEEEKPTPFLVNGVESEASKSNIKNWMKRDAIACTLVINSTYQFEGMSAILAPHKSSFGKFTAAQNKVEGFAASNDHAALCQYASLKFTSTHTIETYFLELNKIMKNLKFHSCCPPDSAIIAKILTDLPDEYDTYKDQIRADIFERKPVNIRTMEHCLKLREQGIKQNKKVPNQVLVAKDGTKKKFKKRTLICYDCRGRGHTSKYCKKSQQNQQNQPQQNNNNRNNQFPNFNNNSNRNSNSNFNNNRNFQNFNNNSNNNNNYNNNRSYNNNNNNRNFNRNRNHQNNNQNNRNFANNVTVTEPEINVNATANDNNNIPAMFNANCVFIKETKSDDWLLDSGASFHLTSNIENFQELEELDRPISFTSAGDKTFDGIAKGTIHVKCFNGTEWKISKINDVYYAPEMGNFNLFSWGQALENGCGLKSDKNETYIYNSKTQEKIVTANKVGNIIHLHMKVIKPVQHIALVTQSYTLMDWHRKLGHINVFKIIEMSRAGLLPPITDTSDLNKFTCEGCIKGKHARKPFKTAEVRKFAVGESFHTDLMGPCEVDSLCGKRFTLVCKDEMSSYRVLFFLERKSEAIESLKAYIAYVLKKTGNKVKIMRSDNASELTSTSFEQHLRDNNITHELSAPYVPQQNGLVERENRTLTELARSMMHDVNVPKFLWVEALAAAAYILNIVPNKKQNNISPYELWEKKKPSYKHLMKFGSLVYGRVHECLRKKWDAKSRPYIFVGYTNTPENIKVYCPKSNAITIIRDYKEVRTETDINEIIEQATNLDYKYVNQYEELDKKLSQSELNEKTKSNIVNDDSTNEEDENSEYTSSNQPLETTSDECLISLALNTVLKDIEPNTYEEAVASVDRNKWLEAMQEELNSLVKNQTYDLVTLPKDKRAIECRWVFRIKRNKDGSIERFKARLVARGYAQRSGVDYFETFSPVARYDSIRAILAITAQYQMHLVQFDVKTAFLYGNLEEEIYMCQPPGFHDKTNRVLKLKKGLYGLKQAPRQWNERISTFFKKHHYNQSPSDNCVYSKLDGNNLTIIVIYVDDGLVSSNNKQELNNICNLLKQEFELKVHLPQVFVGMEITQSDDRSLISIRQSHYIKVLLKRFKMDECKPVTTPGDTNVQLYPSNETNNAKIPYQEAVGALLYLAIISRPDIAFQVNKASQFNSKFNDTHWTAVKRIFRYLKGSINTGIHYTRTNKEFTLIGFADADYAGDLEVRKSTSGFVVTLGDSAISWGSRLQKSVAQSTTEAEYVAIAECNKDILWYIQLFKDLSIQLKLPITIFSDNKGAILLTQNNVFHKRTKHIDVRFHAIRDYQSKGFIKVVFVGTEDQPADMFTKTLCATKLEPCKQKINVA